MLDPGFLGGKTIQFRIGKQLMINASSHRIHVIMASLINGVYTDPLRLHHNNIRELFVYLLFLRVK